VQSSLVFNYYTRITSPMTLLPNSPTVRGFTANNLRGSVRYLRCPLAVASAPDRTQLRGNGLSNGSIVYHFGGWLKVGPASCPTARSCRFGGWFGSGGPSVLLDSSLAALRQMVRHMSGSVPDGLRVSLRPICTSAEDSI